MSLYLQNNMSARDTNAKRHKSEEKDVKKGVRGMGGSLLLLNVRQCAPLLADLGGDLLARDTGVGGLDLIAALSLEDKV